MKPLAYILLPVLLLLLSTTDLVRKRLNQDNYKIVCYTTIKTANKEKLLLV